MLAAEAGNAETVKLLLENGAEMNATEDKGWTALMSPPKANTRTS